MSRSPPKRGRPPRNEKNKTILLRESTFNLWNQKKGDLGFQGNTNSEFAELLLHRIVECEQDSVGMPVSPGDGAEAKKSTTVANSRRSLFHSTPARAVMASVTGLSESPVVATTAANESLASSGMGVFSDASMLILEEDAMQASNISQALNKVNPLYATILGQPFEGHQGMHNSLDSSGTQSSDDSSDESSTESYDSRSDEEYRSDEETLSVCMYDDSSTKTAFETFLAFANSSSLDNSQTAYTSVTVPPTCLGEGDSGQPCGEPQEQSSSLDHSHSKKMHSSVTVSPEQLVEGASREPGGEPQEHATQGPDDDDGDHVRLKKKLSEVFAELMKCEGELAKYVEMANKERVIVELSKILDLFNGKCQVEECSAERKVVRHNVEGGVLAVSYRCSQGHAGVWHSSSVLTEKRGQKVFVTSVLLSSAVLLTGNNFDKVNLMAKMLRLAFVSSSTFNRIQTLHAVPAVKELWEEMKEDIWKTFQDEDLVLCGDARMDSPGFSAKYCAYILMDHYLNIVTDLEVVDKREAGGTSTVMEKMALKRLMERVIDKLKIKEVVTDASSTIIKLLRDMKDQNPETMAEFFHSLDVWHKSCKLTAKLSAAAKTRGCEGIKQWIEPIRNHFWHCAENCEGDETVLKDMWLGVMHHVCNEHEWSDGQCNHGPLTSLEEGKEYLAKDSKAAQTMRDVIFDPQWLNTLKFYVFFRHTSKLESFNSMVLKYAPKRIGFAYEIFVCRILLAVLDHNFHAFREVIEGQYKKVYSKRSKNWHVVPVKEDKIYKYWDILLSKILKRRADDDNCIARHVEVSPTNPQNLAPTIAMREPPATKDLVEAKLSRFKTKK